MMLLTLQKEIYDTGIITFTDLFVTLITLGRFNHDIDSIVVKNVFMIQIACSEEFIYDTDLH